MPRSPARQMHPSTNLARPTWASSFRGDISVREYSQQWKTGLSALRAKFDALENSSDLPTQATLLLPLDRTINMAWDLVKLPFSRCHSLEMRAESENADKEVCRFVEQAYKSGRLLARLNEVDPAACDTLGRRFLEHTLRDMKRSGAAADEATKLELQALEDRFVERAQVFGKNLDLGEKSLWLAKDKLLGLPEDFWDTREVDETTMAVKVTTRSCDVEPVMRYCSVRATRKRLLELSLSVGYPENEQPLADMIELRGKAARLRGFASFAQFQMETTMMKEPAKISALLDKLRHQIWPLAQREFDVLQREMRDLGQISPEERLQRFDHLHAVTSYQDRVVGVELKDVRQYLPATNVIKGVLKVVSDLFDVDILPVEVPVWHESIQVCDVHDRSSASVPMGRIYLDLHPRKDKHSHCLTARLVTGRTDMDDLPSALPEAYLMANIPGGDSLLSLGDVNTLLHELGHCLHSVFGSFRAPWLEFSGISVERDLVEAPSQLLEEWLLNKDVLQAIAIDKAGNPLPDRYVDAIQHRSHFGDALAWHFDAFLAKISLEYYSQPFDAGSVRRGVFDIWEDIRSTWILWDKLDADYHATKFGHLQDYCAVYYSYILSQLICRDLLTAFHESEGGLMDKAVARRYKETVLCKGGQLDGGELVEGFLGRPWGTAAFTKWLERGL